MDYEDTTFQSKNFQQTGHLHGSCPLDHASNSRTKGIKSKAKRWNTPKPLPVSDLEGEEETLTQEENDKQEEDFDLNQKDEDNTKEMRTQEIGFEL